MRSADASAALRATALVIEKRTSAAMDARVRAIAAILGGGKACDDQARIIGSCSRWSTDGTVVEEWEGEKYLRWLALPHLVGSLLALEI